MRRARHFLPSSALPPYPEPYDQITLVSGKWTMYLVSGSQGQEQSWSPGASGAPMVWIAGTNWPVRTISSRAAEPIRVMIPMFTTTYGESVISMPRRPIGEPIGPMENGITYIVRPRIEPLNRPFSVSLISTGSRQLFVGPASSWFFEQMKVRSSTRATSDGSERARKLFGRSSGFRRMNVPWSTSSWQRRSFSSCEPSTQWTASGVVRAATSSTQRTMGCSAERFRGSTSALAPVVVTISPRCAWGSSRR